MRGYMFNCTHDRICTTFLKCQLLCIILPSIQAEALRHCLFPIGSYTKTRVREIAHERLAGLSVTGKRESMGVCFVGPRNMPAFLREYFEPTPGRYLDWDSGACVGHHDGVEVGGPLIFCTSLCPPYVVVADE